MKQYELETALNMTSIFDMPDGYWRNREVEKKGLFGKKIKTIQYVEGKVVGWYEVIDDMDGNARPSTEIYLLVEAFGEIYQDDGFFDTQFSPEIEQDEYPVVILKDKQKYRLERVDG